MSILVISEHDNQKLNPATLCTVSAAQKIASEITILVAGSGCAAVATAAQNISGVAKVILVDAPQYRHHLAENLSSLVMSIVSGFTHILAPATTTGKDFMPRVAAMLDVQQISDIISVESADTFKRPIYAGNAIETVKSSDKVKVITVRPTAFDKAATGGSAALENGNPTNDSNLSTFVGLETSGGERPDLASAARVISGGRGVGSKENFEKIIYPLADKLGAAIGASRAAVDSGFVPNDFQVGQTGKVVAPDLYIAVGISGAIQHLAGMKGSKIIVAINKDENAPIFEVADYGLVADLFTAVPELMSSL